MITLTGKCTIPNLLHSNTAQSRKIDNVPKGAHVQNMNRLIDNIIEPVRKQFKTVRINSGYRSKRLNSAIGGATHSQHCKGQAVDIHIDGKTPKEVAQWIANNLPFDVLINEYDRWVHVSYKSPKKNRGRMRKAVHWFDEFGKRHTKYVKRNYRRPAPKPKPIEHSEAKPIQPEAKDEAAISKSLVRAIKYLLQNFWRS